jgi:hypothetical protein
MYSKYFSKIIDQDKRVYSSAIVKQTDPATAKITASQHPYNWFTKLLLPALQTAAKKFVYAQAVTDQARLAIALERYRIAQGQFPESLETLAPKFIPQLPHDIINGQPLKYQRTTNGSFVLYSVGWNETDDGGTIGLNKGGNFDPNTGDWVWRYPAE